jgi:hypothetical protein
VLTPSQVSTLLSEKLKQRELLGPLPSEHFSIDLQLVGVPDGCASHESLVVYNPYTTHISSNRMG